MSYAGYPLGLSAPLPVNTGVHGNLEKFRAEAGNNPAYASTVGALHHGTLERLRGASFGLSQSLDTAAASGVTAIYLLSANYTLPGR